MFGSYSGYIIPAYAVSAAVIVALVVWVVAIHRRRLAELSRLEEMGVSRRSGMRRDG